MLLNDLGRAGVQLWSLRPHPLLGCHQNIVGPSTRTWFDWVRFCYRFEFRNGFLSTLYKHKPVAAMVAPAMCPDTNVVLTGEPAVGGPETEASATQQMVALCAPGSPYER
jgi:hypothetical protein